MSQKPQAVTPTSLGALAGLGALAALWSSFLWGELRLARAGGSAFCGLGDGADCAAVWDSAFASSVHRLTGMPVAAWGLVWGLVAFALAVAALVRRAQERPLGPLASALRFTAAGGAVAVCVFAAVSVSERALCAGCLATYLIVGGYAAIALVGWRAVGLPEAGRGFALAAGSTLAAYFLLLYPGTRTPLSSAEASREALAQVPMASSLPPEAPSPAASALPAGASHAAAVTEADGALVSFVAALPFPQKQTLADALHAYREATPRPLGPPRVLVGSSSAPVRITEFTDVLCSHCAELHETLDELSRRVPKGSFSVEPRQFPLDGECNPAVARRDAPVRCLAARAQICLERTPGVFAFSGSLYERQRGLKPDVVQALAQSHMPRAELQACLASPETEAKLRSDIDEARAHGIEGTPLVLVNGRRGAAFGPFLYAMVLTKGSPDHPAFAGLPSPNTRAHVH